MRTLQCKNCIKDEKENFSLPINVIEVWEIFLMQEIDRYNFANFKLLQIRNINNIK